MLQVESVVRSRLISGLAIFLLVLPLLSSILRYQSSGLTHKEHLTTLPHLLSGKSIPQIIFDVENMESPRSKSNFQARELSYLADYIDARIMIVFGRLGWAHYLSATKYLFVGLITLLCWWLCRSQFGFSILPTFLLCLIFLTTPSVYHFVYFHHSSKVGVAFFTFAFLCWARYRLHCPDEGAVRTALVGGALLTLGCLFDMQGVYFCAIACCVLSARLLHRFSRRLAALTLASFSALLLYAGYRFVAAAWLIQHFAGYPPEKPYFGSLAWPETIAAAKAHYAEASELFIDYLRFFLGSFPAWVAGLFLLAVLLLHLFRGATPLSPRLSSDRRLKLCEEGLVLLFGTFAGIVMIFFMGLKFHWIYAPLMRPVYYALPLTVCFLFGLCFTVRRVLDLKPRATLWVATFLAVVALGNIRYVPYWDFYLRELGRDGHTTASPAASEMIRALRELPESNEPAPSHLERNSVYMVMRERILAP